MIRSVAVALVLAAAAPCQQRLPVPAAAPGAAAAAVQALAERIHVLGGGSVARTQHELTAAAATATDPAARHALLQQAVAVAERRGHALAALDELARVFAVDADAEAVALLRRMGAGDVVGRIGAALAGTQRAALHVADASDEQLRGYHDAAVRAAALGHDASLYDFLSDRLPWLQRWHALAGEFVAAGLAEHANERRALVHALVLAEPLPASPAAVLASLLHRLPPIATDTMLDSCDADVLEALAGAAKTPEVAAALRRAAIARACRELASAPAELQRRRAEQITTWTTGLATSRGVQALRFRGDDDRSQLVFANGAWTVAGGVLVGACTGSDNFATHRLAFRTVRSAVLRGGIRGAAGLNFRCKIGDVNLLLNWEVQPENHLWVRGTCALVSGPAGELK